MGFQNGWRGPDIVSDGLVLYLDAGSPNSYRPDFGTTWRDMSGFNNSGSLINGPTYSSANGGSIVFDGVDDYINVPSFNIASESTFTLNSWVNIGNTLPAFPIIISENGSNYKMLFGVKIGSPVYAGFNLYLNGTQQTKNTTIPSTNTWYHTVGTFDGTVAKIYINGNLISTSDSSAIAFPGFSSGIWIGNGLNGGNSYWNGNISSTQIYNRALLADEVLQNYNAQKSRFGL